MRKASSTSNVPNTPVAGAGRSTSATSNSNINMILILIVTLMSIYNFIDTLSRPRSHMFRDPSLIVPDPNAPAVTTGTDKAANVAASETSSVRGKSIFTGFDTLVSSSNQVPNSLVKMSFDDRNNPCKVVFDTPEFKQYCTTEGALCMCNPSHFTRNSSFAAVVTGEIRTMHAAFPSFKRYFLDVNAPMDLYYVFDNYNDGQKQAFEDASKYATVLMAHGHRIWQSMIEYSIFNNRRYKSEFQELDIVQELNSPGGIVKQWTNVEYCYKSLKRVQTQYKKKYQMILKTRPDYVYFGEFSFQKILSSYESEGFYRPFFNFRNLGKKVDAKEYPQNQLLMPHRLFPEIPPVFFPGCNQQSGVNDKIFFGPPRYMDVILGDSEWVRNLLSVNTSMMGELVPGAEEVLQAADAYYINKPRRPLLQSEGLLLSWLLWNRIPLAEIPTLNDLTLLHGQLMEKDIPYYCKGNWFKNVNWEHAICVLSALPKGPKYNHDYYSSNSVEQIGEPLARVCKKYA